MKSIYIKNMDFAYNRGNKVFQNFSLSLEAEANTGRVTVVMGPSGSGKSTLLKVLLGIEKIQSGSIVMNPKVPVISYVPQEPVLFEHLSPEKNARYFQFAGAFKKHFNDSIYKELIKDLGLQEVLLSKSVNEISGGQKQRLSLLRALSINPDLLLLDEPCNGLDAEVKLAFLNKLREITEHYGLFVLYITHHKLEAQLIADDVVYLLQDNEKKIVTKAIQAPILNFVNEPPVLEAANVFRFPDMKILPFSTKVGNSYEIGFEAHNETPLGYLLFEDQNMIFNNEKGIPFIVMTKSPVYSILRHKSFNIDLMVSSNLLNTHKVGDIINLQLNGKVLEYNANGYLQDSTPITWSEEEK